MKNIKNIATLLLVFSTVVFLVVALSFFGVIEVDSLIIGILLIVTAILFLLNGLAQRSKKA